jgi:hypothetical protein
MTENPLLKMDKLQMGFQYTWAFKHKKVIDLGFPSRVTHTGLGVYCLILKSL